MKDIFWQAKKHPGSNPGGVPKYLRQVRILKARGCITITDKWRVLIWMLKLTKVLYNCQSIWEWKQVQVLEFLNLEPYNTIRKRLFSGRLSENKKLFAGRLPENKKLFSGIFWKIRSYFLEDFRKIRSYFPQKSCQPSCWQHWCGLHPISIGVGFSTLSNYWEKTC